MRSRESGYHCGIYRSAGGVFNFATMPDDASAEKLRELELLRHEYKAAMSVATDPEEKWRLYRILQELNSTIERIIQRGDKAS